MLGSIEKWYTNLLNAVPNIKIGIIVNKMDCEIISREAVTIAMNFDLENNLQYFPMSCKNGINLKQFKEFLEKIME